MDVNDAAATEFSRWLFEQQQQRELSYRSIARRVGVAASTVYFWASGRSVPEPHNARKIAEAFGVDEDFILDLTGHRRMRESVLPSDVERLQTQIQELADSLQRNIRTVSVGQEVSIRVVGRVPASPGRMVNLDGLEITRMSIPKAWIGNRIPDDLFIVVADGDCLEHHTVPIADGEEVLCRRLANNERPANGSVVFARVGDRDEGTLKVWRRLNGEIQLRDGDNEIAHRFSIMDDFENVIAGIAEQEGGRKVGCADFIR